MAAGTERSSGPKGFVLLPVVIAIVAVRAYDGQADSWI